MTQATQTLHQLRIPDELFDKLNGFLRDHGHPEIVAAMLWTPKVSAVSSKDRDKKPRYDYEPHGRCFPCGSERSYGANMGSHLGKCKNVKKYLAEQVNCRQPARNDSHEYLYTTASPSRHRLPVANASANVPRSMNPNGAPVVHNDFVNRMTGVTAPWSSNHTEQEPLWSVDSADLVDEVGGIMAWQGGDTMLGRHWCYPGKQQ